MKLNRCFFNGAALRAVAADLFPGTGRKARGSRQSFVPLPIGAVAVIMSACGGPEDEARHRAVRVALEAVERVEGVDLEKSDLLEDGISAWAPDLRVSGQTVETGGINFGLPSTSDALTVIDGSAVIDGTKDTKVVVNALPDGVRILTVLESPDADTTIDFQVDAHMFQKADGTIVLENDEGEVAGFIEAPWAVDAAGNEVPTHYEVGDGRLKQIVEITDEVTFPVTADPTRRRRWFGYTFYFNRSETRQVATGASLCRLVLGRLGTIGRAISVYCGVYRSVANSAVRNGKCLRINVPWTVTWTHPWYGTC